MGKIPGGDRAFIDPAKIAGYLLNPQHRIGQHKARVFAAALGLRATESDLLIDALKQAAAQEDAEIEATDDYGVRYAIQFTMAYSGRSVRIVSGWIVRKGEEFPRFVTAMVAKQDNENG